MSAYRRDDYEANREAKLAYQSAYYKAHRDERVAYSKQYRARNRTATIRSDRERYKRDRDAILARNAVTARVRQRRFSEWYQILLGLHPCADCGAESYVFHHTNPATKKRAVAAMASYSLDALETEIEKCVALCSRCHQKRHVDMRREVA